MPLGQPQNGGGELEAEVGGNQDDADVVAKHLLAPDPGQWLTDRAVDLVLRRIATDAGITASAHTLSLDPPSK